MTDFLFCFAQNSSIEISQILTVTFAGAHPLLRSWRLCPWFHLVAVCAAGRHGLGEGLARASAGGHVSWFRKLRLGWLASLRTPLDHVCPGQHTSRNSPLACAKPSPPSGPGLILLRLEHCPSRLCSLTPPRSAVSPQSPLGDLTALSTGRCCLTLSHHADVFLCVTPLVRTDVVLLIYLLVHPPSSLGQWALRRQPPAAPAPSLDRSSRIQGILVPLFQHKTDKRGLFPYS